jgi:hypothetical protein
MSSYNKKQLEYLTGGKTNYALLSSLRRSQFREKQKEIDDSKLAARGKGQFFPSEYVGSKKEDGTSLGVGGQTAKTKAGVTSLGIMKATGDPDKPWELDTTYNNELEFGNRLIRPDGGVIRALSSELLKESLEVVLEKNKMTRRMVAFFLSDPTGSICKYVLPDRYYLKLGDKGTPQALTSMAANTPAFAEGLTLLKNVTNEAIPHIHFEDDINDLLDKFDDPKNGGGGSMAGCCCK